jgi:hypothetical protein
MRRTERTLQPTPEWPPVCCCGRDFPYARGLCRSRAHSRQRFAGLRDEILDRDGRRCPACGSAGRLHVHHRKLGVNIPASIACASSEFGYRSYSSSCGLSSTPAFRFSSSFRWPHERTR